MQGDVSVPSVCWVVYRDHQTAVDESYVQGTKQACILSIDNLFFQANMKVLMSPVSIYWYDTLWQNLLITVSNIWLK